MSDRESVSPIFLDCAYSERSSPASITSSSGNSETSLTGRRSTKGNKRPDYKRRIKPPYSYVEMITMAIKSADSGRMTLRDITNFLYDRFECFRGEYVGWKNSVRHNLSASECFTKNLRDPTRPYGKDNYWVINENCEHCKNNIDNAATCKRILATSKHSLIMNRRINTTTNKNKAQVNDTRLPLNLIIQARSSAGSDSDSDVSSEPHTTEHQTNRLYHPPTNSMYPAYHQPTQQPSAESYYHGGYYDQHYAHHHHASRYQHRYHPYTNTSYRQHGRYPMPQQGLSYVDDLSTLQDLYVPAADIDFSVYNNEAEPSTDGKMHPAQPFIKEQPHGFVQYLPSAYDYNYQYYTASHLPTPYQYSDEHRQITSPPGDYESQRMSTPDYLQQHSYVHPYPYNFISTAPNQMFSSSSPSSIHSMSSEDSCDTDSDTTVFLPTEALALTYDN